MCVSFANGVLSLQTGSLPVMLHSYYYMCAYVCVRACGFVCVCACERVSV